MQDFLKKLLKNEFFIVGAILVLLFLVISFMQKNVEGLENVADVNEVQALADAQLKEQLAAQQRAQEQMAAQQAAAQQAAAQQAATQQMASQQMTSQQAAAAQPDRQQLVPEDLLQQNGEAAEFVQKNEVMDLLKEQNFLVAGHHVGLDTVMQSNKIAYHDLRSAPPIPKEQVGPWNQSSYEQPAGGPVARRYLEIGSQ